MSFLLVIGVFALAMLGMAVGWILAGRRLRGSCGGLAGIRDEQGNPICEACTNPAEECAEYRDQLAEEAASR